MPAEIAPSPAAGSDLVDTRTGLVVRAGLLTAIVSEQPDDSAELADRLGMAASPVDDEVRLGGVPLTSLHPTEVPRADRRLRHRRACSSPARSATAST